MVALNVYVKHLGSNFSQKVSTTISESSCTAVPPINSICLRYGWSMGIMKSQYFNYEVTDDQLCGIYDNGINPFMYEFWVLNF